MTAARRSGRVWRKVPESGARSLAEGAGKRCSEFGGRCRKAVLGVWRKVPESGARSLRKVPESGARSLEEGAGKRCSKCGGMRVHARYIIFIDRFYIALFSALEQTRCARM